jgi:hypothetical protein
MTKIPTTITMKVCEVIMGEDSADKAFDVLVEKALDDAGVGELIEALSNANRVLDWFADELNWREEELCEGIHFSAEWKIGFDPMELARQAKTKSVAALAKVGAAP